MSTVELWPDAGIVDDAQDYEHASRWRRTVLASAVDVAKYLIFLADSEEEPACVTHMQVQKLLYYVQGWSLAIRDRPMFKEQIQAWSYGPVVSDVYPVFAGCGSGAIDAARGSRDGLDDEDAEFVAAVWEAYKPYSAIALSKMTHDEPPWKNARHGIPPEMRSTSEITVEAMTEYFKSVRKG